MSLITLNSLRWRLVTVMSLAYIVVAMTTLAVGYNAQERTLHNQLETSASSDSLILAAGAAGPLILHQLGSSELVSFVASIGRQKGQSVAYAAVVNSSGKIVATTDPKTYHKMSPFRNLFQQEVLVRSNGDVESVTPIVTQGVGVAGYADIRLSGKSVQDSLRANLLQELLLRLLGLVIFLLLSLIIAQYILGPLGRLSQAVRSVRRGEYHTRVAVDGGAELGTVAEAFNEMAESLERRIAHLSFLARAGPGLPNLFRTGADVEPILSEFCEQIGACGAGLIPRENPHQVIVGYSLNPDDTDWWKAATAKAAWANQPTSFGEDGYMVMVVPVLGEAVFVTAREEGPSFTQEERQVITNFAYQIGIAADNARLLESQQEALQVKDQFLSIVSHELRTPLTTIKGYAQMLRRKLQGDAQSERFADNIDAQVGRLSRLVDDLLDVTRFTRGQFDLMPERMDIRPVLEDVVNRFRLVAPKHKLQLYLDRGPFEGDWDHDRLEQVMNNLVSNAIKYSPEGGTVTVATHHDGDTLTIYVRDQGVGIPEAEQAKLFERFYRGSAEGQDIKGLGLGLYVTRRIIEAHGGSIDVRSRPGQGSEFYFTLPLARIPARHAVPH